MATTFVDYTGDGNATKSFSFPSIKEADIKVEVDNVVKTSGNHYNITSYTTTGGGNVVFTSGNIPASPAAIRIFRDTDVDTAKATFTAGSSVKAGDLNNNMTQILYAAQEEQNQTILTSGIKDAAVTTAKIKADNITSALIADDQIDSEHYVDGSIDTAHIADSQITSAKIADGTIVAGDLASNAITTVKITDSNVTTAKIADSNVTTAKIADSNITTAKIADANVTTAKIANANVTTNKIADNAVTMDKLNSGALPTDVTVASANLVDGTIATADIADNAVTMAKLNSGALPTDITVASANLVDGTVATADIADANITTAKIADSNVTTAKIAADAVTSAKIADDAVGSEHIQANSVGTSEIASGAILTANIADGQVITSKLANTNVTDAKLASNAVTTSKITDANVTTVKIADSNVTLAKLASDLKQTTISDSDTQLPTSGAVVDYVAAQIAPIGGLEVIATEVAFPNTQPQAGVVISIADAGGIVVNGSGTSTTGRTVGGSTVTINNINSQFNSTTVDAGVSFMVSSTGSGQVYNYHKATLKEADLLSLSGDINDFAERYRVSADPDNLPNKDEGDLVYDTNANKMKVYDNSTSAWKEVTSTGDFKYLFLCPAGGTGAPTINGSIATYDLRESSNSGSAAAVTSAAQLIVSINGVVQKANTGTSAPAEGFALVDANTIVFGANLQTGDSVFIVQIGSAISVPVPGDGTVSTAKLASSAVTTAKIADEAVTADKIGDLSVSTVKLASSAVTTAKIADDAVTGDKIATSLDLPDNNKIRFGTGNDFQIFHDGTNTMIDNDTGDLKISSSGTLRLRGDNVSVQNNAQTETMGFFSVNGAAKLYYDNAEKLQTTSSGVSVTGEIQTTGHIRVPDNMSLIAGTGSDLFIYHNGTDDHIDSGSTNSMIIASKYLRLMNQAANETMAKFIENGAVELNYDNSKKLETLSGGIKVTGQVYANNTGTTPAFSCTDNGRSTWGSGDDLQIYHDGSNSRIKNATGHIVISSDSLDITNAADNENIAKFDHNGAVSLYYDNSKKFETTATGVTVTGKTTFTDDLIAGDNVVIRLGNATGGDLSLYHDGSNSYIKDAGTGNLNVLSSVFAVKNAAGDENMIVASEDGNVELYHDNSKKLETKSNGVEMHGYVSTEATSGSVAQFYHSSSADTIGIIMRHGRGGLSGFNGKMISFRGNDNTEEGSITIHTTSTAYNTSSDYRLKENEVTISDGIARLKTLKPYKFNFKKEPDVKVDGFFAHEVSSIVPEAITGTKDQVDADNNPVYQGIDQSKLVPLLTAALQEAVTKIETLETKVAALEAA